MDIKIPWRECHGLIISKELSLSDQYAQTEVFILYSIAISNFTVNIMITSLSYIFTTKTVYQYQDPKSIGLQIFLNQWLYRYPGGTLFLCGRRVRRIKKKVRWTFFPPNRRTTSGGRRHCADRSGTETRRGTSCGRWDYNHHPAWLLGLRVSDYNFDYNSDYQKSCLKWSISASDKSWWS
jgi:hypothetical protein